MDGRRINIFHASSQISPSISMQNFVFSNTFCCASCTEETVCCDPLHTFKQVSSLYKSIFFSLNRQLWCRSQTLPTRRIELKSIWELKAFSLFAPRWNIIGNWPSTQLLRHFILGFSQINFIPVLLALCGKLLMDFVLPRWHCFCCSAHRLCASCKHLYIRVPSLLSLISFFVVTLQP